jgi:acyl carrier protein
MATIEQIKSIIKEFIETEFYDDKDDVLKALDGNIHRTVGEFWFDSLDLVELEMMLEDELDITFDDDRLDNAVIDSTLFENLPEIFYNAQLG